MISDAAAAARLPASSALRNAAISAIQVIPPWPSLPAASVVPRLTARTTTGNRRRAIRARPAIASSR